MLPIYIHYICNHFIPRWGYFGFNLAVCEHDNSQSNAENFVKAVYQYVEGRLFQEDDECLAVSEQFPQKLFPQKLLEIEQILNQCYM